MAAIECLPLKTEARHSSSERRYTSTYRVTTNDPTDGFFAVTAHPSIPADGSYYSWYGEVDAASLRDGISCVLSEEVDSKRRWTVVCEFTTKPRQSQPNTSTITDPVLLPPDVSGDFVGYQKPVERDKDGYYVCNSALDDFEADFDESYPTLVIAKNYATLDLALLANYVPSVNSTAFWGLDVRCAKLVKAPWQRLWKASGVPYYRITFEWHVKWDNWDFKPADRGFYFNDNYQKVRAYDKQGLPLSHAVFLDGDGNILLNNQTPKYYDGVSKRDSGAVMDAFRLYRERDYALLQVPMSL